MDQNEQKLIMQRKISDECDQLLRDLELDMAHMKKMNGNIINNKYLDTIKRSPVNCLPGASEEKNGKSSSENNKQTFFINKVKMVELQENYQLFDNNQAYKNGTKTSTKSNKNVENNYSGKSDNQEYFDSLIRLIENAARNLSD